MYTRATVTLWKTSHFTPGASRGWAQTPLLVTDPVLVSRACSGEGTSPLLTWTPREVTLDTVLRPTEVLNELLLVQRRQQGARALPHLRVRQQPVSGFAKGLSKLIVVLRDEALVAEEETKIEQSLRWRWKVSTGRISCFRAFVGRKGHGQEHTGPGVPAPRRGDCTGMRLGAPTPPCCWSSGEGGAPRWCRWLHMKPGRCVFAHACFYT